MEVEEKIKILKTRLENERERKKNMLVDIESYKNANKDYTHLLPRLQHIEDRIEVIEFSIKLHEKEITDASRLS